MDRTLYIRHMQDLLFNYPNLDVRAGSVFDLDAAPSNDRPEALKVGLIKGVKLGGLTSNKTHFGPRKKSVFTRAAADSSQQTREKLFHAPALLYVRERFYQERST